MKSSLTILNNFFHKTLFLLAYKKLKKERKAAQIIYRAFLRYRFAYEKRHSKENAMAFKIQKVFRHFLNVSKLKNELKYSQGFSHSPRFKGRIKKIIQIKDPLEDINLKRLSQSSIDEIISNQKSNLKFANSLVNNLLTKTLQSISDRNLLCEMQKKFERRIVKKSFYYLGFHQSSLFNNILTVYFHKPTFQLFVVTRNSIIIQSNEEASDKFSYFNIPNVESEITHIKSKKIQEKDFQQSISTRKKNLHYKNIYDSIEIIDSAFDSLSGRIFCLLSDWTITIFEYHFFSKPIKFPIKKPIGKFNFKQRKYISCDKYGYLWGLSCGNDQRTVLYLIDSIALYPLKNIIPEVNLKNVYPIYSSSEILGFLGLNENENSLFLLDGDGHLVETINQLPMPHLQYYINEDYLITFSKDKDLMFFSREKNQFKLIHKTKLLHRAMSATIIKGWNILIVSLHGGILQLFNLSDNPLLLTYDIKNVPSHLVKYYQDVIPKKVHVLQREKFAKIREFSFSDTIIKVETVQYSDECVLLTNVYQTYKISTYYLTAKDWSIHARDYDIIDKIPFPFPLDDVLLKSAEYHLSILRKDINVTRNQLYCDSNFLKQIYDAIDYYVIPDLFRASSKNASFLYEKAADIILQSPYSRWCRYLNFAKIHHKEINTSSIHDIEKSISIFELYRFLSMSSLLLQSFTDFNTFSSFVINRLQLKNTSSNCSDIHNIGQSIQITKCDICFILGAIWNYSNNHFKNFSKFEFSFKNHSYTSSTFFTDFLHNKTHQIISRLSEIENLIKNQLRLEELNGPLQDLQNYMKKEKRRQKPIDISFFVNQPIYNPNELIESPYLLPNPLFEHYCYKPWREDLNSIKYGKYQYNHLAVKAVKLKSPINDREISFANSLADANVCTEIYATSNDHKTIVIEYPIDSYPLQYLLSVNPFNSGFGANLSVARYIFSQILLILETAHRNHCIIRNILPSNLLFNFKGKVSIFSLSDAFFLHSSSSGVFDYSLSYASYDSPWIPPEYWDKSKEPTPAFDIFQFGILLVYVLTGLFPKPFALEQKKYLQTGRAQQEYFFYDPFLDLDFSKFSFFVMKGSQLKITQDIDSLVSFYDIAKICLDVDPIRRPSASQLLHLSLFSLSHNIISNSNNRSNELIRSIPISIFVKSVFDNILHDTKVDLIMENENTTSLKTILLVLRTFLDPINNNLSIYFPIKENLRSSVTNEIFHNRIMDTIAQIILLRLKNRFEQIDAENLDLQGYDDPYFLQLIQLYHQLFKTYFQNSSIFKIIFPSFLQLALGNLDSYESHRLFIYLHIRLRPLIEFVFTKTTSSFKTENDLSAFYCNHFLEFYDNIREFYQAFQERSWRRTLAFDFLSSFIDLYPISDTFKLIQDFKINHKIEQIFYSSFNEIRLSALNILFKISTLPGFTPNFWVPIVPNIFTFLLESSEQPNKEKLAMLRFIQQMLLSGSLQIIRNILSSCVLDSLFYCTQPHKETTDYLVWDNLNHSVIRTSKEVINSIFINDAPLILSVTDCSIDTSNNLKALGINIPKTSFSSIISETLEQRKIHPQLPSFLQAIRYSPLKTSLSIFSITESQLKNSFTSISTYFIQNNFQPLSLYFLFLEIYYIMKWEIDLDLMNYLISDDHFRKPAFLYNLHIFLSHYYSSNPNYIKKLRDIAFLYSKKIHEEYDQIIQVISSKTNDFDFMESFHDRHITRIKLFKTILEYNESSLWECFENDCGGLNYICTEILPSTAKFELNFTLPPESFVKYNRTYPLRSEALYMIKCIIQNRSKYPIPFLNFVSIVKRERILAKESYLVLVEQNPEFRKTSITLLNILEESGSPFNVLSTVLKSELLMSLKDEGISDWDNLMVLKSAWAIEQERKDQYISKIDFDTLLFDNF